MKKISIILSMLCLGAIASFAQGTVAIYSVGSSTYYVTTNNLSGNAPGAQATGNVSGANQYYFALLTSSTLLADNPTVSGWNLATTFYATNYSLGAGAIRGSGGAGGAAVSTIPLNPGPSYSSGNPAQAFYYIIMGWSANLGGYNAASTIISEATSGNWSAPGYYGFSAVGQDVSGNPSASLNAVNLFGNPTAISGFGLSTGFQLDSVVAPTPEPGTMALAALGGASLLLFRRRK